MKNWNTDTKRFTTKRQARAWQLSQMLEYGRDGEELSRAEVKEYWPHVKNMISPEVRRLWELKLWGKVYSLPTKKEFWRRQPKLVV